MPTTVVRRTAELAGLDVPLIELTGSSDGPLLTVLAGVHGCEYASIAAVRRWARDLEGRELRGRVRAVPVLNVTAFAARAPFVVPEDGKNLNRCFPGDPGGTLAERLAYDTFRQLIRGSDALIDAHCGDLVEALQPFSLYESGPAEDRAKDMADAYGLPYIIRQEPGPDRAVAGTTVGAAAQIGIPAICAESGGCGLVEPHAVALHEAGLNRVLQLLGMTDEAPGGASLAGEIPDGETGRPEPHYLKRFLWLRCRKAGWWEPLVKPGESVAEGQVIGAVTSLDGAQTLETITAPADCVAIFITSSPAVADDGLLIGLGAS
jgi:predicted deacylase